MKAVSQHDPLHSISNLLRDVIWIQTLTVRLFMLSVFVCLKVYYKRYVRTFIASHACLLVVLRGLTNFLCGLISNFDGDRTLWVFQFLSGNLRLFHFRMEKDLFSTLSCTFIAKQTCQTCALHRVQPSRWRFCSEGFIPLVVILLSLCQSHSSFFLFFSSSSFKHRLIKQTCVN
jgi:hypothetical protein